MSAYNLYYLQEKTAGGTRMTITSGHTTDNSNSYLLLKTLKRNWGDSSSKNENKLGV